MSAFGRERVQFFEIVVPKCANVYGDAFASPTGLCQAVLGTTGTRKCFNGRFTCQDPDNYTPTDEVVLRFARGQAGMLQYGYVLPMMESLRTTPGAINLAAMDDNMASLGMREVVQVSLSDAKHDDLLVDPYRLERETGEASLIHAGTVPVVSPSVEYEDTLLLADDASGDFTGRLLQLLTGPGSVQEREITAYNESTKVATVSSAWSRNALTKSSAVDHANWTKQNSCTITANYALAPDGTLKADRAQFVAGSLSRYFQQVNGFAGQTVCFALKMRSLTGANQSIFLHLRETGFGTTYATQTKTVTPEWQLFSISAAIPGGSAGVYALVYNAGAVVDWDIAVCDHQWNAGSVPDEFIETDASAITLPTEGTTYQVVDAFDPYERGTFWGKFIARNPYHANYRCRVREGYMGQPLDEMDVRHYIIDRIEGPNEGSVRIIAKDLFSRLEARKAVAPAASTGELAAAISDSDMTATLSPAGVGDDEYPVVGSPGEFYVAIGDEIIRTQRSGNTLSFEERGALGTTAASHDEEDVVQLVLGYEAMLAQDIVYDLLVNYGGIDASQIDQAEWDTITATLTTLYTGFIAEPTPVAQLVGELCQQAGFTVWHDTATDMIRIAVLRAQSFDTVIDDDAWIKDGSLTVKRQDDRRVSQVWVYYGQRNRKEDLEKRDNYSSRVVVVDLDAESDTQYGVPKIREVFSRWIPQFGRQSATDTGERVLSLFRNAPLEATLSLHHSRGSEVSLAQYVGLRTSDVQDVTGATTDKTMAVVEIERGEHELTLQLQEVNFYTAPDSTGDREIFIENDSYNLNLRTIHDGLYGDPPEGSPSITVTFRILEGITVGSTSTASPALRTGDWSDLGVNVVLEVNGRIEGKAGNGGTATSASAAIGTAGGLAFKVDSPLLVSGAGEIFGGGGGGGAGGNGATVRGGGGGGGAGFDAGSGGAGAVGAQGTSQPGQPGTADAGGSGGAGIFINGNNYSGNGGDGGDPGQAGSTGGTGNNFGTPFSGGAGGAAGSAIDGVSLVTFASPDELDIRGAQVN